MHQRHVLSLRLHSQTVVHKIIKYAPINMSCHQDAEIYPQCHLNHCVDEENYQNIDYDHRRGLRTMMISPPPRPPWQQWSSKSPLLCTSLMACEFTIMMAIMSCTNQSLTFIQHENALYANMQIISKCCKSHTNHCSP